MLAEILSPIFIAFDDIFSGRFLIIVGILLSFGATAFRSSFEEHLGRRGTTAFLAFVIMVTVLGFFGISLKDVVLSLKNLGPHLLVVKPERTSPDFLAVDSAWNTLRQHYLSEDPSDRQRLSSALDAFPMSNLSTLSGEQKAELAEADDFISGWKRNTLESWNLLLAAHPSDDLTPILRYEVEKENSQAGQPETPLAPAISKKVLSQINSWSAAGIKMAHEGRCGSARGYVGRIEHFLSQYHISIASGKTHEPSVQTMQNITYGLADSVDSCDVMNEPRLEKMCKSQVEGEGISEDADYTEFWNRVGSCKKSIMGTTENW